MPQLSPSPAPASAGWIPSRLLAEFAAQGTDAHRLYSGEDGFVERLGDDALLCYRSDTAGERLDRRLKTLDWQPARVFGRFLGRHDEDRVSPNLLRGDASLPLQTIARENGVHYGLDFEAGASHGLFLDQRANRAWLRHAAPQRLLNTFAYTCSFSVVAALSGAETVSVDLSKKSLQRGRANFERNEISLESGAHRFLADDVLEVIPRLARRGDFFDAIVLDPPTFSRGNKGRLWKVEEHFGELLDAALSVAAPGARVLLSTNCTNLDVVALELLAGDILKARHQSGTFHQEPKMPDFPAGHGATTLWLLLNQA